MLAPAATGSGESVLVTDRSARVTTAVAVFGKLLISLFRVPVVTTLGLLLRPEPLPTFGLTFTTKVNVAEAPAASVAIVAEKVPVPPTGGVVSVNAGPAVCVAETNVVLTGTGSFSVTPCASLGPELVTVTT